MILGMDYAQFVTWFVFALVAASLATGTITAWIAWYKNLDTVRWFLIGFFHQLVGVGYKGVKMVVATPRRDM
jgi:hypothetical protein